MRVPCSTCGMQIDAGIRPDVGVLMIPAHTRASTGAACAGGDALVTAAFGTATLATELDITDAAGAVKINALQVLGPQGALIADPAGGATTDAEARTAIGLIIDRMVAHGLIHA